MGVKRNAISFMFILFLTAQVYSKPPSDQYKQQAEPDPVHKRNDEQKTSSLHKVQLISTGLNSASLLPQQTNLDGPKVAELQIGCADGSVQNDHHQTKKEKRDTRSYALLGKDIENVAHFLKLRSKREIEADDMTANFQNHELVEEIEPEIKTRNKRNYFPWFASTGYALPNPGFYSSGPSTPFQYPGSVTGFSHTLSHSHYNLPSTPSYSLVIPLFGGQLPIFFPPRPIIYNPGYPPHNRPTRPERPQIQSNTTDMTMITDSRFGDPNGNLDDHPVWGVVDSQEVVYGGAATAITTRRPSGSRPTKPPTPPLFHRPSLGDDGEGNIPLDANDVFNSERIPTTTRRPFRPNTQRPVVTSRPQVQRTTTALPERELPKCTWAIITCCNPTNERISSECFENAGCGGAFWDTNPCSKESTLEALEAAQRFYESQ